MDLSSRIKQARLTDSVIALIIAIPLICLSVLLDDIQWISRIINICFTVPFIICYFVFSPLIFKSASPGMRTKKLRFADANNDLASPRKILKRWLHFPSWAVAIFLSELGRVDLQKWELEKFGVTIVSEEQIRTD